MFFRLFISVVIAVYLISVLPDYAPTFVGQAQAQEKTKKPKRKNLLELLFGGGFKKKRANQQKLKLQNAKRVKLKSRKIKKKKRATGVTVAAKPAVPVIEKREDAAKILVIGDFMADQLSQGLETQFASNPGIVVVNKSNALSGLVRDDVINWPVEVSAIVDTVKPIAVIALVGMNDRQQIRTASGRFNKLTEEWTKVYDQRVDALTNAVRNKRLPMIWVGLPPVSKGKMNPDYLVFNETYRRSVEAYGGVFVDVWDGFVDDQGRYTRSGPDVNGQIVALRRVDGINMTRSGKEKLGFYAEKAVKRVTGFSKNSLVSSLSGLVDLPGAGEPQYDPQSSGRTIVIALGSPAADGGSFLEGAEGFLHSADAKNSASFDLVSKGYSSKPQAGRIDAGWGVSSFDLKKDETPEPVLANMRGFSLKTFVEPVVVPKTTDQLPKAVSDLYENKPFTSAPTN